MARYAPAPVFAGRRENAPAWRKGRRGGGPAVEDSNLLARGGVPESRSRRTDCDDHMVVWAEGRRCDSARYECADKLPVRDVVDARAPLPSGDKQVLRS